MAQNLISQTMTDAQRDALLADLDAFDTKYATFKVPLTPAEIRRLAKLGPSDIGLLRLAHAYAIQNPDAVPGNVPVAEMAKDTALAEQVLQVNLKAQQKADMTRVTLIAAMSDAFKTALRLYGLAQAQGRTPETAEFLDAFGERFAKGPQEPPPTPPTS